MVLESLINVVKAERKPSELVIIGFFYTSAAILLSEWLFHEYSTMTFVFLTAMASVPLLYNMLRYEEKKDLEIPSEKRLLKEHGRAFKAFLYLFLGITVASAFWYVVLPANTVMNVFESQTNTLITVRGHATNVAFEQQFSSFIRIFLNNVQVMIFSALFSFLYGAGAIFILAWNASVIGTAIGNFVRGNLASYAHLVGFEKLTQYFQIISIGLLKYAIHGIPEILAYIVAALGGGIISVAVINHDFRTRKFEHVILDSADLFLLSIALLLIAGILEVWVTPLIF